MSKDLIFDFETMGQNTQKCVVLDCAYFIFDRDRFVSNNPYTFNELVKNIQYDKFDVESQSTELGYVVESSTVDWWKLQGKEAQKRILPDKSQDIGLNAFLDHFFGYVSAKGPIDYFWSRSNTFDPIIMQRICRDLDRIGEHDRHLPFWTVRDTRTFIDALNGFQGAKQNSFIPIEDHDLWFKHFEKHNCVHDVAADILRMQVLTRLYECEED